jgi:hypothetical protein
MFVNNMNAQKKKCLNNDSIDYSIEYVSIKMEEEEGIITPSKYVVVVELTDSEKEYLKTFSNEKWLILLNDGQSDFATNLLLYSFLEKDATLLLNINKEGWRQSNKEEDISCWRSFIEKSVIIID